MEVNDILAKARKDLENIERKLWIQAYVSRKENPLIDLIASTLILICSYFSMNRYFTQGAPFPFWIHAAAFFAITACISIAHRCMNGSFTQKAEKLCPITTSEFHPEEITDMDRLAEITAHGYFDMGKIYYAGPLTALVSIASWIGCSIWFSKYSNLPVPFGCTWYLIVMCAATSVWFLLAGILAGQSLTLPLSEEVRSALRNYRKEKQQEALRQQKEAEEAAKREQEEKERAEAERKAKEVEEKEKEVPPPKPISPEAPRSHGATTSRSKYNRVLTYGEKVDYIQRKFNGLFSYHAIETIEKDPDLTPSQKEDLKLFLKVHGD